MDNFRKEFIKELLETLKIPTGAFNIATVQDEIEHISNENLRSFYKSVLSADTYGNGMKAIIQTAERFKPETELQVQLKSTRAKAEEMYQKFYSENCAITDYTQKNRDKVSNDRKFFESLDYSKLKRKDGTKTFTTQELYVLNELGGGSWLCDIRFLPNTEIAINKIENIIKKAVVTKYSDCNQIAGKTKKMLGRIA